MTWFHLDLKNRDRSECVDGSSPPASKLEWEVIGTFRYDDGGRLAEEWVQTDYGSFLTKLGVTTTES